MLKINESGYDAFEISFILFDERTIKCSGILNERGEDEKVYRILKNSLPEIVLFSGNKRYLYC